MTYAQSPVYGMDSFGRFCTATDQAGHPCPRSAVLLRNWTARQGAHTVRNARPSSIVPWDPTPVGCQSPQERCPEHPGRAEVDPGRPGRRSTDLRDHGQPVRPQRRRPPLLGREEQGRTVLYPGLRLVGQPDRSPLRTAEAVHHRQFESPEPHRPDPGPARLPPVAQRQRPHRDLLAAERKERARIRSEKGIRWGGRPLAAAA